MGVLSRIGVAAVLAALAGSTLSATPAAAATDRSLTATVVDAPVLTLPAGDGVRDTATVRIASGRRGDVELFAVRGARTLRLTDAVPLRRASRDWGRTVRIGVGRLTAGRWSIRARRTDDHAVRATARLRVGSGRPASVRLVPSSTTLYPYADRVLDGVGVTIAATDETGVAVPVRGSARIDAAKRHRTRTLHGGAARLPVTGLPLGPAVVTATVRAPAGTAVRRAARVTLAATGVGTMRLGGSSDTLQPVRDGLLDTLPLTSSGAASGGSPATTAGTLVITGPKGVARRWKVPDGAPRTFDWDGRVGGVIVPGTYTATLRLTGPEGPAKVRTRTITVSKNHLPYRVRDLFGVGEGNQQGLAVHDDRFYVATDVGGSSRIDVYRGNGTLERTLGVLPLGHGAELSYSTASNHLWAVNGGPVDTRVWKIDPNATDPAAAVLQELDLTALGPNGMIAVDDLNPAGARLLVFAGRAGAYTVSDVSMVDGAVRTTTPIEVTGLPQGIDVVGSELWVYTSLRKRNHIGRYTVSGGAIVTAADGVASFDLMNTGEGEGLAVVPGSGGTPAWIYVGAHGPNRVGVLEQVADE